MHETTKITASNTGNICGHRGSVQVVSCGCHMYEDQDFAHSTTQDGLTVQDSRERKEIGPEKAPQILIAKVTNLLKEFFST